MNARHLPYGLALPDFTGPRGRGWRRLAGTHLMNDESVVFALAQDDLPRQRAAYWACGLGVLICWPGGAILGALIGSAVHDTNAFGLDATFPAVILALIVPDLRDRMTLRAALTGAAIALIATPFLPAGLPVLLALAAVLLLVRQRSPDEAQEPGRGPMSTRWGPGEGQHAGCGRHGHPGRRNLRLPPVRAAAPGQDRAPCPGPPKCSRPPP